MLSHVATSRDMLARGGPSTSPGRRTRLRSALRPLKPDITTTIISRFRVQVTVTMPQRQPPPPPPPQWVVDLNTPPTPRSRSNNIPDPPGFSAVPTSSNKVIRPPKHVLREITDGIGSLALRCCVKNRRRPSPNNRRNRHSQAQEVVGGCPRSC